VLGGTLGDATNVVYLWARDRAGLVGDPHHAAVLVLAPAGDFDSDGFTTEQEELAGTDARDAQSRFGFVDARTDGEGSQVVLEWQGVPERRYTLYGRTSLTDQAESWQPLPAFSNVPGVDGFMVHTAAVQEAEQRFYSLGVSRP
jgi:hypothetical protein